MELKEIKQELAKFPPSDVIWDIEDLSASPPWGATSVLTLQTFQTIL